MNYWHILSFFWAFDTAEFTWIAVDDRSIAGGVFAGLALAVALAALAYAEAGKTSEAT